MKKAIIAIIIVVVVALIGWRVATVLKSRAQGTQETEKPPVAVEVEDAKIGKIQEELSLVGNIVGASEVNVFPKVAGRIEQILVDEGSNVKKGAVMAKIEDKTLALQVKQAEVALETAKTGYEQAKALAEIKVRAQVAQAEAGFASAEAALKQVRDIAQKRVASQLEQAEAGLIALKANLKKIREGAREEEKKQIEATVQQAKAGMENAQADLGRIERLYSEGAVSKQTLDATRTRETVASAQYQAALQQLKLVETGAREEDILAVESQVRQAEAGLELAKQLAETKSWEKDIQMAEAGYNQAKAGLETARALEKAKSWEAEIAAAEAGVKQAETALELAKEMLSYATITAPISGTVSKRFLDKGSMSAPASPLFTIVDMDKVKAVVEVTEADLAKITPSAKPSISVAGKSEDIHGKITLISPTVKPVSRTATVEITIDNSIYKLKPGSFAKVKIPVKTKDNAIIVRRSAVLEDKESAGAKYLFIVENNKAVRRNVEVGIIRNDVLEILSEVKAGEKVVVSGQNYLKDGESVGVLDTSE